jgi:hypothetical protein
LAESAGAGGVVLHPLINRIVIKNTIPVENVKSFFIIYHLIDFLKKDK